MVCRRLCTRIVSGCRGAPRLEMGLRYEYMSPLTDIRYTNSNLDFQDGKPDAFIGGQLGYPTGLRYSNKLNFAPRFGVSHYLPSHGTVLHAAFGIFYTPVDMNTWCNQRHNVPYVFPETQQADNFTPPATLVASGFNFGQPVLGLTTVSFASMDLHGPPQYIEQWSASVEKRLGNLTTLEIGYLGSHGLHLQRAHLVNNALPGPGAHWSPTAVQNSKLLAWNGAPYRHYSSEYYVSCEYHQYSGKLSPELVQRRLCQRSPPLCGWFYAFG